MRYGARMRPSELVAMKTEIGGRKLKPLRCAETFDRLADFSVSSGSGVAKSSQVKLLVTNNAFSRVQRATAHSKTGFFRGYGVAEAPPGFQAGWSGCMYIFLSFCSFVCSSVFFV
jgi:hypothetical protein